MKLAPLVILRISERQQGMGLHNWNKNNEKNIYSKNKENNENTNQRHKVREEQRIERTKHVRECKRCS